jgi:fatty-acyl-CoA synthase
MVFGAEREFPKTAANHVPLSPLSFLRRANAAFPAHPAVIYGERRYTWSEVFRRSCRLANALRRLGIKKRDTVSIISANTPELFEAHFGVPMSGAVLNTINTRLDAETIGYILSHGNSRLLFTDTQFSPTVKAALAKHDDIMVVDIVDESAILKPGEGERLGRMTYREVLLLGDESEPPAYPVDEWNEISLNYTSGTSGTPKGVVYHHRGAYLMALGTVAAWNLPSHSRYLYTVPMFHCNGWCHAWALAVTAGTAVCLRYISARTIFEAIAEHRISHFGGAPVVLSLLVNAPAEERRAFDWPIRVLTAGAPPPAAILEKAQALGLDVMQVYGLTETFGHVVQCAWRESWNALDFPEQASLKARQGIAFPITEDVRVAIVGSTDPVARNGEELGEILIRGNTVMSGYLNNSEATAAAFEGGWFHSGDLAVQHPDGYIEIKDRLKDVIISGGENISSVEVEAVLHRHPAVAAAAVVARPDEKWGETPCAFIELQAEAEVTEMEIIAFCRQHLAGFKTPKRVIFAELPKTSTGKIQKNKLRQLAKELQ